MRIWITCLVFGLLALFPRSADATTPESGLWWNPAESGSGYAIEIQNDVLTVLAFTYHGDGKSAFYSSANRLQNNMLYRGTLDGYRSGQCLGCAYTGSPVALIGEAGEIVIAFESTTRASLTIAGRTVPIQRFDFGVGGPFNYLYGQWQLVIDVSSSPTGSDRPYIGDVLNIDGQFPSLVGQPPQFTGCRPAFAASPNCDGSHVRNNRLLSARPDGTSTYRIDVGDGFNAAGQSRGIKYEVSVGLTHLEGTARFVIGGVDQPGVYPVRGFRTASKKFVQTGTGPSNNSP